MGALPLALALVIAAAGCAGSSSYRIEGAINRAALGAEAVERHAALVAEGDSLWRQRSDPARLLQALDRWRAAVRIKDDDWKTYARLARGYFFLAEVFYGFKAMGGDYPFDTDDVVDPEAARRYREALRRGYRAALRGMAARSPELEQRLRAGIDLERAVLLIRADGAPLLYWYVTNLARWAKVDGFSALFSNRHRILASIRHLHRIAPRTQYGGGYRLLGVYHAVAPGVAGGDLDRARRYFEDALEAAPEFLLNQVFAAEFLDRRARDRASFEERLRAVLAAPDGPEEIAPENAAAKRMARRLLGRLDRYFPSR